MTKADFLTAADNSTQALKIETSRLQEQLSTLLFAEPAGDDGSRAASTPTSGVPALSDTTAKIFEIAAKEAGPKKPESSPERLTSSTTPAPKAPVSAGPAFEAEEVKIPAWLQPLARNAAIPAPPEPASNVVVKLIDTHKVIPGDNLWDISQHIYGNGLRYTQIYAANANQIRNPRLIYPGQIFVLPQTTPF